MLIALSKNAKKLGKQIVWGLMMTLLLLLFFDRVCHFPELSHQTASSQDCPKGQNESQHSFHVMTWNPRYGSSLTISARSQWLSRWCALLLTKGSLNALLVLLTLVPIKLSHFVSWWSMVRQHRSTIKGIFASWNVLLLLHVHGVTHSMS